MIKLEPMTPEQMEELAMNSHDPIAAALWGVGAGLIRVGNLLVNEIQHAAQQRGSS